MRHESQYCATSGASTTLAVPQIGIGYSSLLARHPPSITAPLVQPPRIGRQVSGVIVVGTHAPLALVGNRVASP